MDTETMQLLKEAADELNRMTAILNKETENASYICGECGYHSSNGLGFV